MTQHRAHIQRVWEKHEKKDMLTINLVKKQTSYRATKEMQSEKSENHKNRSKKEKKRTKKINNNSSTPEEFLSFDVECVATGYGHLDRTPVSLCIVDYNGNPVFYEVFRPDVQVRSYLTSITGFREEDLVEKRTFRDVLDEVLPRYFNSNVVLVGQGIKNDIRWLKLEQGRHYKRFIDLADMFCVEYKQYGRKLTKKFALRHVAKVLLDVEVNSTEHSAEEDALHSMRLFKLYGGTDKAAEKLLKQAKHNLHQSKPPAKQSELPDVTNDGVCCCGYRPRRCQCGQPSLTEILGDLQALHRDYPTIDLPCRVSTSLVSLSRPAVAITALSPPAPPLPQSAAILTPAPPTLSVSPASPSITVPHVNNRVAFTKC